MAFKLTKGQAKRLAEFRETFATRRSKIEDEFRVVEQRLAEVTKEVNEAIREYNADVDEFNAFRDEVASEHRDAYDDKTETWKESDRGVAASEFVETWEQAELDEIGEVEIVHPDEPEFENLDALDDLPEEAES